MSFVMAVNMQEFADMIVCEQKLLPQGHEKVEMSAKEVVERFFKSEVIATGIQFAENKSQDMDTFEHLFIDDEYSIPAESKTDGLEVCRDYAKSWAIRLNKLIKDHGIKKIYFRDAVFSFQRLENGCGHVFVAFRATFANYDRKANALNTPPECYFVGSLKGYM